MKLSVNQLIAKTIIAWCWRQIWRKLA